MKKRTRKLIGAMESGNYIFVKKENKKWIPMLKSDVTSETIIKLGKKIKAIHSKHTTILFEAIGNKDAKIEYHIKSEDVFVETINFIKYYEEDRTYRIKDKKNKKVKTEKKKPTVLKNIKKSKVTTDEDFQTLEKLGIKEPKFDVSIISFSGSLMRTVCRNKRGEISFVTIDTKTLDTSSSNFKFEKLTKG